MAGPTPAGAHAVGACAAGPQTLTVHPSVGRAANGCGTPLPGTAHTSAEGARDALFCRVEVRRAASAAGTKPYGARDRRASRRHTRRPGAPAAFDAPGHSGATRSQSVVGAPVGGARSPAVLVGFRFLIEGF